MTRTFTSIDLVALPRLDAVSAVALTEQVLTAAKDKSVAKAIKKEGSITALLELLAPERDQLQAASAVAAQATPAGQKGLADRREDAAYAALHDHVAVWAKLDGEIPEGATAAALLASVFAEGVRSITHLPVPKEWAAVDGKLKLIAASHEDAIASIGAKPLLDHLRKVHTAYGEAAGTTKALPEVEPPLVRERREQLTATLRDYVVQVTAAVSRRVKPIDGKVGDMLLRPIAEWTPAQAAQAAADQASPSTPATPAAPASASTSTSTAS